MKGMKMPGNHIPKHFLNWVLSYAMRDTELVGFAVFLEIFHSRRYSQQIVERELWHLPPVYNSCCSLPLTPFRSHRRCGLSAPIPGLGEHTSETRQRETQLD